MSFKAFFIYITGIILWRLQNIWTIQMYCRKTTISKKASLLQKIALFIKSLQLSPKLAALSSLKYSITTLFHCYKLYTSFVKLQNLSRLLLKQELSLDYLQTCYTTKQFYFYVYNLSTVYYFSLCAYSRDETWWWWWYYFSLLQWYNIIIKMTDEIYLVLSWLIKF